MRSALLTVGSLALSATVIGNAYYQKKQFYPSVVYITKSNPSMAVIYVQAFVLVVLMGKIMRKVFFGQLRAAELEHLIEKSWYAVTETCLAFTVFRDDFSPKFIALFTVLLFLKCFHWLADDRVDYMERSPIISLIFHSRVLSLLLALGSLDAHFVNLAYYSTLTKGASVQLVFGFEYAILLTIVINIFIKYVLHTVDLQSENPWENKAVYLLYTELVMGFIKVVLYMTFMVIMIKIHTFPLFAIRPMYLTLRAFKKALNDVVMSRRAIRNMNTLYPDASPEELASADNVCIICREEMFSASKKLPCNHIFHTSCLRSWFQRQQTCPTCRMDVLRASTPQQPQQQHHQQQPGQQQPQAPHQQPHLNLPGLIPGMFPPGFPLWPHQQQQQQADPSTPSATTQSTPTTNAATGNADANMTAGAVPSMPSSMMFPPFPFMPLMIPPPRPPPNFSGLTEAELHAMEGQERRHVEARIDCLRNIQTLLDAAVVQMQQYSVLIATLPPTSPAFQMNDAQNSEDVPSTSTKTPTDAGSSKQNGSVASTSQKLMEKVSDENETAAVAATSSSSSVSGSSSSNLDEREQLRRRRLQRFEETTPHRDENTMELD